LNLFSKFIERSKQGHEPRVKEWDGGCGGDGSSSGNVAMEDVAVFVMKMCAKENASGHSSGGRNNNDVSHEYWWLWCL
jgi:hypothetical protein